MKTGTSIMQHGRLAGLILLTILTTTTGRAASNPPDQAQAQKQFQVLLSKLDSAEKRHDINAWANLLRQNSIETAVFKQFGQPPMDIEDVIAAEHQSYDAPVPIKVDVEHVVSMKFAGNTAHAIVSFTIAIQGSPHHPDIKQSDLIYYDLVRAHGKWLIGSVTIANGPKLANGAKTTST